MSYERTLHVVRREPAMSERPAKGEYCEQFDKLLEEILRALPRHLSKAFLDSAHAQTCLGCQETYAQVVGHVIIASQRAQLPSP